MAIKRQIVIRPPDDEEEKDLLVDDSLSDRDIAIFGTWREWFFRVFLKYVYFVSLLFFVCAVPLEIVRVVDGDIGLFVAIISLLVILTSGMWAYFLLWGSCGRW